MTARKTERERMRTIGTPQLVHAKAKRKEMNRKIKISHKENETTQHTTHLNRIETCSLLDTLIAYNYFCYLVFLRSLLFLFVSISISSIFILSLLNFATNVPSSLILNRTENIR